MKLSIQITKLKFHQYQTRAVLPNLMLTKVTRYMHGSKKTSYMYAVIPSFPPLDVPTVTAAP